MFFVAFYNLIHVLPLETGLHIDQLNCYYYAKVPETVTHRKRLDVKQVAIKEFEGFLDKISP
jgi:hypothetical protein